MSLPRAVFPERAHPKFRRNRWPLAWPGLLIVVLLLLLILLTR